MENYNSVILEIASVEPNNKQPIIYINNALPFSFNDEPLIDPQPILAIHEYLHIVTEPSQPIQNCIFTTERIKIILSCLIGSSIFIFIIYYASITNSHNQQNGDTQYSKDNEYDQYNRTLL